ncbi:DUF1837 domain-containing protein [Bradyrhizobium sp. 1]|nr:DUF1837 domain-containing protein [Bradyrhizobium sp. 1]
MTGMTAMLDAGIKAAAAVVPGHYASPERVAHALRRLGKTGAAKLIEDKLPTTKQMRSGDLGEIFATEWIDAYSGGYRAPIKRLRWKDHRNMAMRGDDVIGMKLNGQTQRLLFLKTEAKSRGLLTAQVVAEARAGLDKDGGLPSAHALTFISECLFAMDEIELVDAIDDAQRKHGIPGQSVTHLMFVFTGNAPETMLTNALQNYAGSIGQWGIGLHVDGHGKFIGAVYDMVIGDANNA